MFCFVSYDCFLPEVEIKPKYSPNKSKLLYFDSVGLWIVESEIIDYLKYYYKSCIRSNTGIQDITSTKCGAFFVAFILSVKSKKDLY